MSSRKFFCYADLGHACGVPDNANNNRRLGKLLERIARRDHVKGIRPGDAKRETGHAPRRGAMHYPASMFFEACLNVAVEFGPERLQQTIPDETFQL